MWVFICLGVILVVLFLAGNYFYNLAICNNKKTFLKGNKDLPENFLGGIWAEGKEWINKVGKVNYTLKSRDNLTLKAFLVHSSKIDQKVFVILAHGYNSKGLDMGAYAKFFNEEMDFNILAPDDRGHGQSDGKYIGFGWPDRLDYLDWINFLIQTYGQDIEIILFGLSMGGATVLMLSGEKLPSNVKAVISDCAYTSALDVLTCQLKRQYGFPPFPIMTITSLIAKFRAGYFLGDASALAQVKKSKIPILFIHGMDDNFVPFEMVNRLYEACKTEKRLLAVEGAGHSEALIKNYDGYRETVKEFIRSVL